MPQWAKVIGKWAGYILLAALALLAFKENDISRKTKEQAVRYNECIKAGKGTPDECAKISKQ